MSLQARTSEWDHRLYSVNRDVAHNFAYVVQELATRLTDDRWKEIGNYLRESGVTEAELGTACKAFIEFVASAASSPKESMEQALTRVGWFKLPAAAQVAYMAYLGTILSGIYFHGAREATTQGKGPCAEIPELISSGVLCEQLMTMSKWRRGLYRFVQRVKGAINVLAGKG